MSAISYISLPVYKEDYMPLGNETLFPNLKPEEVKVGHFR